MGKVRCQVIDRDGVRIVEEYHKVVVHRFRLGDVDDPEIYAAQPIWDWQQTDAGKFIMENSIDQPIFHKQMDISHYGWTFAIEAELESKKLAEFYLKWGKTEWK